MKTIQSRRNLKAYWELLNPILKEGEFGYESDTGALKIGTGNTWLKTKYLVDTFDAPSDNRQYVRKDGEWQPVIISEDIATDAQRFHYSAKPRDFELTGNTLLEPELISVPVQRNPFLHGRSYLNFTRAPAVEWDGSSGIRWTSLYIPSGFTRKYSGRPLTVDLEYTTSTFFDPAGGDSAIIGISGFCKGEFLNIEYGSHSILTGEINIDDYPTDANSYRIIRKEFEVFSPQYISGAGWRFDISRNSQYGPDTYAGDINILSLSIYES